MPIRATNRSCLYRSVRWSHVQSDIDYSVNLGGAAGVWPLQEESGTRKDFSINANHLTDNNTVTDNLGPTIWLPRAAQFTRANSEYVDISDNASLSTGDISFTTWAWVYKDSSPAGEAYVYSKDGGGSTTGEYGLLWENVGNRFRFYISNTDRTVIQTVDANTLGAPSNATWYFIVAGVDLDAATLTIQVNNGVIDSTAKTVTMADKDARFTIGGRSIVLATDSFWDGRIAGGGFIKRVLTAQERAWLYNGGFG